MSTRAATLALSLIALGCSKGPSVRTEEQFCQDYAHVECSKVADVCGFSEANCEPARVDACHKSALALKSGGHQFNPANTDACLNKLTAAYQTMPITATMLKAVDDVCARVFAGVAKATEPCMLDYDCVGGLICDKGRCAVQKTVSSGGLCANPGEQCPRGEYCTSASGVFICARRADMGVACGPSVPCLETLRCLNTCVPLLDSGGSCNGDDDCLSGYCTRYIPNPTCGPGLTFSPGSASCTAFMGIPDGGLPVRGGNDVGDGGADAGADASAAVDAAADGGTD